MNFGPLPLASLPFKCRMMNDAAEADVQRIKYRPNEGRPEVLFPVFLPGEGTFHWLDWFLTENPEFTEISDRMIVDWCMKSGIKRAWRDATRHSNDKPAGASLKSFGIHMQQKPAKAHSHLAQEMNFGIYALDVPPGALLRPSLRMARPRGPWLLLRAFRIGTLSHARQGFNSLPQWKIDALKML